MKAVMIAFSMYSRIPMPRFIWEEEDRKRAMCFFPMVGAVTGGLFFLVFLALSRAGAGDVFRAACLTAVPLLVTGGIHMDGFLDTCDARASYGDRERKLEILKDSHTGAFAVIWGVLYLLLSFAACTELGERQAAVVSLGFILSRSLSGFSVATFPEARKHGMLADFMRDAHKRLVAGVMIGYMVLAAGLMVLTGGLCGMAGILAAACVFFYYRRVAIGEFGGVTGDLAGYFLQLCELFMALAAVACGYLISGGNG